MAEQSREEAREQLAGLIKGRPDAEIIEGVRQQGIDTVLGNISQGMAAAFLPEKAANVSAVVQYDITVADSTHSFQLKIADGNCEAASGAAETPRVTIAMSLPDFLRLVSGELNGQEAFMGGKLKLKGDMSVAMIMQTWFEQAS